MYTTNFTALNGHMAQTSSMADEHQIIQITEKTPLLKNIGKIVCGDTNSNILTFEINRYYDGVDLCTKSIKFIVQNELGVFTEDAVNMQYNEELMKFSWILSDAVTYKSGNVTAAIAFVGAENGYNYTLKTVPFQIKIESTIDFTEYESSYKNWFTDVECRLLDLERKNIEPESEPIDFHSEFEPLFRSSLKELGNNTTTEEEYSK